MCPGEWEDRSICFQIKSSLLLSYLLPSLFVFPSAYKYSQVILLSLTTKKEQNKTLTTSSFSSYSFISSPLLPFTAKLLERHCHPLLALCHRAGLVPSCREARLQPAQSLWPFCGQSWKTLRPFTLLPSAGFGTICHFSYSFPASSSLLSRRGRLGTELPLVHWS